MVRVKHRAPPLASVLRSVWQTVDPIHYMALAPTDHTWSQAQPLGEVTGIHFPVERGAGQAGYSQNVAYAQYGVYVRHTAILPSRNAGGE